MFTSIGLICTIVAFLLNMWRNNLKFQYLKEYNYNRLLICNEYFDFILDNMDLSIEQKSKLEKLEVDLRSRLKYDLEGF